MPDQVIQSIVRYKYDENSGKAVIAGSAQQVAAIDRVTNSVNNLTTANQRNLVGMVNYARQTGVLTDGVQAANVDINQMSSELLTLEDSYKKATAAQDGLVKGNKRVKSDFPTFTDADFAGGGNGKAITQFGSKLRSLPSIQIPGTTIGSDSIANIIRMAGALEGAAQAVPGVTAAAEALTPVIGATAASMVSLLIPVAGVAIAVAPLIIAFKILSDREAEAAKNAKALADIYAGQVDAFAVGQRALQDRNAETRKAAVDEFNALNESYRFNTEKIIFLKQKQAQSDEKTAAEIQKQIDSTIEEQTKLSGSIDILRGNLEQLGAKIDGVAPGLSKIGDGTNNFFTNLIGKINQLNENAHAKLDPILARLQEINEAANKRAEAEVKVVTKLNADLTSLDQKAADARASINVKLIDNLLSVNDKALENAEKIAADLDKQQAASALKLSRDEANASEKKNFDSVTRLIAFNRDEITARKKHDLDLKQLREDAAEQEFSDGLDRNFAQLAADRRASQKAISRSNENFNAEEAQRIQSFKDKNDDATRQAIFEHEQRVQAYQQQAADQVAAANAALKQNESDRIKSRQMLQQQANLDISDLQKKLIAERSAKTQAAIAELQLVTQTEAVKRQVFIAAYQQAQDLLNGIKRLTPGVKLTTGTGSNITSRIVATRAGGGSLANGQAAFVNEPNSSGWESYTNSRGTIGLPGFGIFQPIGGGGTVNSNNNSMNVNIPITIQTGGNPAQINAITPTLRQGIRDEMAAAFKQLRQAG